MYNEFYGFRESPFNITPDPRFLFFSDKHREAFNHVLFGIRERKGFIQITGEGGAGKTTVCRAILAELGDHCKTGLILNPMLTATQMMRTILTELGLESRRADRAEDLEILDRCVPLPAAPQMMRTILTELGLESRRADRAENLDILNRFLLEQAAANNDVVLLIDEAQDLDDELPEQVRLLSHTG